MGVVRPGGEITEWWAYAHGLRLRRRLAVLAHDSDDVVARAGGWLFDQAQAGWEVVAALEQVDDIAPLHILGASVVELEGPLSVPVHHIWPDLMVVSPEVLVADSRVRAGVQDCLDRGLLDIVVWDEDLPDDLDHHFVEAHHHLSAAARAFKSRALAAGGAPADDLAPIERFRCGSATRLCAGLCVEDLLAVD